MKSNFFIGSNYDVYERKWVLTRIPTASLDEVPKKLDNAYYRLKCLQNKKKKTDDIIKPLRYSHFR